MKPVTSFLMFVCLSSLHGAAVAMKFSYAGDGVVNQPSIEFLFKVSETGVLSLDATSGNRNARARAASDNWDNADLGTLEDEALFGKEFKLTVYAENEQGMFPPVAIWADDGGVLGVGGHNSRRIDGQVLKSGRNLERMIWRLEGDVTLKVLNFACASGVHNGGIILEGPENEVRTGTMKGNTTANWNLPEGLMTVSNGETLIFKADPDLKNGAGLAGIVFDVVVP